jgi:hypothetical protein
MTTSSVLTDRRQLTYQVKAMAHEAGLRTAIQAHLSAPALAMREAAQYALRW